MGIVILMDKVAVVHIQWILRLAIPTLACKDALVRLKRGKIERPVPLPIVWIKVDSSALKALVRVLFYRQNGWWSRSSWTLVMILLMGAGRVHVKSRFWLNGLNPRGTTTRVRGALAPDRGVLRLSRQDRLGRAVIGVCAIILDVKTFLSCLPAATLILLERLGDH